MIPQIIPEEEVIFRVLIDKVTSDFDGASDHVRVDIFGALREYFLYSFFVLDKPVNNVLLVKIVSKLFRHEI